MSNLIKTQYGTVKLGSKVQGRCGFCYEQKIVKVLMVDICETCEKEMKERKRLPETETTEIERNINVARITAAQAAMHAI